jgi:hypothetical protein
MRYASYSVKRPHILNPVKPLPDSIAMQVIYVKEEDAPRGKEPIEWFLATSEPVNSAREAYEYIGYYMRRWKGEDEWKLLYCAANKTRKEPKKPYTMSLRGASSNQRFGGVLNQTFE